MPTSITYILHAHILPYWFGDTHVISYMPDTYVLTLTCLNTIGLLSMCILPYWFGDTHVISYMPDTYVLTLTCLNTIGLLSMC